MMTQDKTQPGLPTAALFKFNLRDAGTLTGLIIIVVTFSLLSPVFWTLPNLLNILQQSSINAIIALGMTLVIISGGIDLSVGPTAALSAVLGATLMVAGVPVPLAVMATLGVGAEVWQGLSKCHRRRSVAEEGGELDVGGRLVEDLIAACGAVRVACGLWARRWVAGVRSRAACFCVAPRGPRVAGHQSRKEQHHGCMGQRYIRER